MIRCTSFAFRTCNQRCWKTCYLVSRNTSTAIPELTSVRYKVERGPYAALTDSHVSFFNNLLDHNRVITDPDECEGFNVDWVKMVRGKEINPKKGVPQRENEI